MQFFNGKEHAKKLDKKIKEFITSGNEVEGNLAIIQIGDNGSSEKYVSLKKKIAKKLGINVKIYRLDDKKDKSLELLVKGSDIIYSPNNTSVIVQLPLPTPRLYSLLTKIPYKKDVDMLSEGFKRKYYSGDMSRLSPVVKACEYFIDSNKLVLNEKNVLVIGNGELVGKPIAFYLKSLGANVIVTEDYKAADAKDKTLIVSSAGVPNLVRGEDMPEGCSVIDFGSSVVDGKVVGDLDLDSKLDHLKIVSPSPGGMGPLVVRFLFMNHLKI